MSRELDTDTIRQILASGDFDQFKGAVESQILECKSVPYILKETYQKQELAKDVTGMANAEGGFILLGVITEPNPMRAEEEITEVRPILQNMFDPQQCRDVLKHWIYPTIERVEIEWFPSVTDDNKGIVSLVIPPQPPERHPFLVTRTVDEDNSKLIEVVFGYFERRRTSVDPMSVLRLQTMLQTGLHFQQVAPQLENIQQLLEQLMARAESSSPVRSNPVSDQDVLKRLDLAFVASDLSGKPSFGLAVRPIEAVDIPSLFRSKQEKVVQLLENPPKLRTAGFDLNINAPAQMTNATKRRSVNPGNGLLELWRDGTLVFAARGDEHFLSWPPPMGGSLPPMLAVHAIAVIEVSYLFSELSRQIYLHAHPPPEMVEYIIVLKNMTRQQPSVLALPSRGHLVHAGVPAPDSDIQFTIPANLKAELPSKIAFNIAALLFEWYGVEHDRIPFQTQPGLIDVEQMAKI